MRSARRGECLPDGVAGLPRAERGGPAKSFAGSLQPEGFSHEGSSLTRNGGTMSTLANPVFPRTDHSSRPTSFALDRASPLPCALTKNASLGALECAVTKSLDLKSPEINTCKKMAVGGLPRRILRNLYHSAVAIAGLRWAVLASGFSEAPLAAHVCVAAGTLRQAQGGRGPVPTRFGNPSG